MKIIEMLFSEKGMKVVNTLFFLSMLLYRSGFIFIAYVAWIVYLSFCMDEATAALDVSVQKTIIELMIRLQRELGLTIGFICHDIALVQQCAHQVAVMYLGNVIEVIEGGKLAKESMHPYTKALLGAVFDINMDFSKPIESIESEAPSPLDVPKGCPFRGRCECSMDICAEKRPQLTELEKEHWVACHLFADKNVDRQETD